MNTGVHMVGKPNGKFLAIQFRGGTYRVPLLAIAKHQAVGATAMNPETSLIENTRAAIEAMAADPSHAKRWANLFMRWDDLAPHAVLLDPHDPAKDWTEKRFSLSITEAQR